MELVQGATPFAKLVSYRRSLERQSSRMIAGVADDHGVSEGREDVREVFQQCGSRAKRKLSRCGRNQMGNEPILALQEGADDLRSGDYHSSMDVLHLKHGMERNVGYRFMGRNWRELWVVEGLTLERCIRLRISVLGAEYQKVRLGGAENLSKPKFTWIL
ncbi:hypothetical protein Tco_0526306 [Tanacetum coccineum]